MGAAPKKEKKTAKVNKWKLVKFLLICCLCIYAGWTMITQQIEISQTKKELETVSAQLNEQKKLKEELTEKQKLVDTPEYIEKIARDELDYAAPDEIIFKDATQQ